MAIKLRYNGRRFPRSMSIRGGANKSFTQDRREIELDDYDAYVALKSNSRLTPELWEFSIAGVSATSTKPPTSELLPVPEVAKEAPLRKEEIEEKPEKPKYKQAISAGGVKIEKQKKGGSKW